MRVWVVESNEGMCGDAVAQVRICKDSVGVLVVMGRCVFRKVYK